MARAIGIDLGTTYTVVATIQDGRPRVIPNAEGQHLTPSVVAFTGDGQLLVGEPARRQAAANPEGTVFSIKRRMGSDYRVRVDDREFTPQEVSSFILRKVKADAESYLGERIDRAVITVPAYFNDRQRQATREAGLLAGLEVMRIINEPTAAALAYGLHREDAHTVLVWDLGGGTFDVSILELGDGIFEVRAVSGDTWLGGDDFDSRLVGYLLEEHRRASEACFPTDAVARQRLREAAEEAKIRLSSARMAQVCVPPLEMDVTREQLEDLTRDLLQRMAAPTQQALADAGLTPDGIDRCILVGGATRMPAVRELARQVLRKEPYRFIDPDEVVAMGAAIQAGMLMGTIKKVALLDVLPLSLGVETQGGLTARIIPRNTPLPASEGRIFTTAADYQTSMDIHVLQGERELAADNISLGRFQLNGIPASPKGAPRAEVSFEVDVDGIVHVSARDILTDDEVRVKVTSTKFLDQQEMSHIVEEAARNAEQDRENREGIMAAIEAMNLISAAEAAMNEKEWALETGQRQKVMEALSRLQEALASGMSDDMRSRGGELREVLAAIHGGRRTAGPTLVKG